MNWERPLAGALIAFGSADLLRRVLGRGMLAAFGHPLYVLTRADRDMLVRAGYREAGTSPAGVAAVLYALANHYMRVPGKRELYPTLASFTARYSTPMHDAARAGQSVAELPVAVRTTVAVFAAGMLPDPIGGRTDWRASWAGYHPADAVNVGGNVFGLNDRATRGAVRVL